MGPLGLPNSGARLNVIPSPILVQIGSDFFPPVGGVWHAQNCQIQQVQETMVCHLGEVERELPDTT